MVACFYSGDLMVRFCCGDGVMVGSARLPGNRVHDQDEAYFNKIVLW